MNEIWHKFEIAKQAELSYVVLLDGDCVDEFTDEIAAKEYVRWFSAKLRAAYEAGEIAMREKAAKRVEGNSCAETCKHCQTDPCGKLSAIAIRALAISGAEESTPAELP